jgi:CopG family transcriptional regulator/antitoxin EndoAI
MRTSKILPISLPPDMLDHVTQLAKKEHRTKSELVREALRRYIDDKEWTALRSYGTARAKARGITEADVDRIIHEYRQEKRKKAARGASLKQRAG